MARNTKPSKPAKPGKPTQTNPPIKPKRK